MQAQREAWTAMAMTMTGEVKLPAARETVWAKLNDAEVLKACIPGCEELTQDDPTHFSAIAKVKIGPVKATFRGKVELSELDPPNGYRINGEGEGGVAGYARGGAKVTLSDAPEGGTLLSYDVEAQVGGKIMQLGARLINSVAKKYADEFFANFERAVAGETPAA
jgi:carbon monoxide dehydrogenase subunit G